MRSDRIGTPVGLHERRVPAWLRSVAEPDRVGGTIEARPLVAGR